MSAHSNVFQLPVQQVERPAEAKRGPQVEDGYTRIANELFEAVTNAQTCPITLRQMRVVLAVIRKTYGFQKKADRISDGQIAAETGLSRQNVNKAKRELLAMHVLFMEGNKIGVNKAYTEWDFTAQPEKDNLKQTRDSVSKPETKSVSKNGSHKRQKDTKSTDVDLDAPKNRNQRLDVMKFADQINPEVLQAFVEHRRAIRSNPTQRALELTVKAALAAAEELGITAEQAIDEAIAAGWRTIRTDWLRNRGVSQNSNADAPACPQADILVIWNEELGSVKGTAPNLLDWKGTKPSKELEARWAEFYAAEVNGRVRYDSVESGLAWWRMAFQTLRGKQNFLQSDVDVFNLFYKETFTRAAQGKLRTQMGAVR